MFKTLTHLTWFVPWDCFSPCSWGGWCYLHEENPTHKSDIWWVHRHFVYDNGHDSSRTSLQHVPSSECHCTHVCCTTSSSDMLQTSNCGMRIEQWHQHKEAKFLASLNYKIGGFDQDLQQLLSAKHSVKKEIREFNATSLNRSISHAAVWWDWPFFIVGNNHAEFWVSFLRWTTTKMASSCISA